MSINLCDSSGEAVSDLLMIEALITSKTRIKLLLKFFLNPSSRAYLRGLESEFKESTNGIRQELLRFEKSGMLTSVIEGNKKMFQANTKHPLFKDIQSLIHKYVGIDRIIETVVNRLGNLEAVYIVGDYAHGVDGGIIDLVFVGEIDKKYLVQLVDKAEKLVQRKIRYLIYLPSDFKNLSDEESIIIWNA